MILDDNKITDPEIIEGIANALKQNAASIELNKFSNNILYESLPRNKSNTYRKPRKSNTCKKLKKTTTQNYNREYITITSILLILLVAILVFFIFNKNQ